MSQLEEDFEFQLMDEPSPLVRDYVREFKFPVPGLTPKTLRPRHGRFDFAWPAVKVAVEIEGGTWMPRSRHTSGAGFAADCEKYNAATVDGWRVLRFTGASVDDESAVAIVRDLLGRLSAKTAKSTGWGSW